MSFRIRSKPDWTVPREVVDAYKIWEKKLRDSGFVDIEDRGARNTVKLCGRFKAQNDETRAFYQCAQDFYHEFDFKATFGNYATIYRALWHLFCNGIPFRTMSKWFAGHPVKGIDDCPKVLQTKVSYFWCFSHTHGVIDHFYLYMINKGFYNIEILSSRDKPQNMRNFIQKMMKLEVSRKKTEFGYLPKTSKSKKASRKS